jgi:hypothetical protein
MLLLVLVWTAVLGISTARPQVLALVAGLLAATTADLGRQVITIICREACRCCCCCPGTALQLQVGRLHTSQEVLHCLLQDAGLCTHTRRNPFDK